MSAAEGSNTLVLAPNWVGDTVMGLPVIDALAASGRSVSVLARPHLLPLLKLAPSVSGIVTRDDSDLSTVESLQTGGYSEAVVLPNSFRSAWLARKGRIGRRWGNVSPSPEGWARRYLLTDPIGVPRKPTHHQIDDYSRLLAAMGVPASGGNAPRLGLSSEQRSNGQALLVRSGIKASSDPIVGLFAGAEFGPSKRWPWGRFAALSRELRKQLPKSRQIILAGPKEVWQAVRIHEESGKIHPVVGPDLDLAQLAQVLANLDLMITNDSGPMHLAAAVGVPCLALFGPTDPNRTRPVGDQHEVVYTDRWCSPCFRRSCPLIHHRCLKQIEVDLVADHATRMLSRSAAQPAS